jgi:hypothetical protein
MQQVARAAYYTTVKITAVKGFMTLAPGRKKKCLKEKNFFQFFLSKNSFFDATLQYFNEDGQGKV